MRARAVVAVLLALAAPATAAATDIVNRAIVLDDGRLRVGALTIRLADVYFPPEDMTCRVEIRPVRCAERAVLALDGRINGFVRCTPRGRERDGTIIARCTVPARSAATAEREDLGRWLIRNGWVLAGPQAPFDYVVAERLARSNGRGIWGMFADEVD